MPLFQVDVRVLQRQIDRYTGIRPEIETYHVDVADVDDATEEGYRQARRTGGNFLSLEVVGVSFPWAS